jgi:hypothetical protein
MAIVSTALLMDFLDTPEKRDRRMIHLPMGRFGEAVELAKGALFRKFPISQPICLNIFFFFS